jgi:hypothetical protein
VNPPTPVVYITGMGRSGSTVLELLLGQIDGWAAGGELRRYWLAESTPGWICGCRRLVSECEFWGQVRAELRAAGIGSESYPGLLSFQRTHLHLRPAQAMRLVRDARRGPDSAPSLIEYQRAMASLYAAVARAAGADVVVDSSKQPQDAYLTTWNPGVEAFAVHLIRDPRGVAYSFAKRVPEPQPDLEYMPSSGAFGTAARWTVRHGFVEALVTRRLRGRLIRLRYEDLTKDPEAAVRSVAHLVDPSGGDRAALGGRRINGAPHHTISGNPLRLRDGAVEVRPDQAWVERMSSRDKALATIAAAPLLGRYGYPRHPH